MVNKWETYAEKELHKSIDYIMDSICGRLTNGLLDDHYLDECKVALQESVSKFIDCRKAELNVPKYITGQDIQAMHNEKNPDHPIGYKKALDIKDSCRNSYEKEFGKTKLHNDKEIPLSWYETYYGEQALDPRIKRQIQKEKDAPADQA